jgi:hypothetical protein
MLNVTHQIKKLLHIKGNNYQNEEVHTEYETVFVTYSFNILSLILCLIITIILVVFGIEFRALNLLPSPLSLEPHTLLFALVIF